MHFAPKISARLTPFIALLLAGTVLAAPPDTDIRLKPEQLRALGIEVRALSAGGGLASALPAQVVVPNEQLRVVAAPLAGMVSQLLVAPGESVKKGQPLARLASPALLQAEREYLQAAQQAQLANQTATRDAALLEEGIIATARAQASRSAQQQAAAALVERREVLRLAGVPDAALASLGKRGQLPSEMIVSAPIDGNVLEQSAAPGQRVEAAAPLFRIGKLDPLWLEIQAPAALAPVLREGVAVSVGGTAAAGKIINVGRAINASSQTLLLRARIDSNAGQLVPGQMVEAALQLPNDGSFTVPQAAVVRHEGKAWVFVTEGDGTAFRPLEVTPAGQAGERVLVKSPALKAETRIAVRGTSALTASWLGIGKEE